MIIGYEAYFQLVSYTERKILFFKLMSGICNLDFLVRGGGMGASRVLILILLGRSYIRLLR